MRSCYIHPRTRTPGFYSHLVELIVPTYGTVLGVRRQQLDPLTPTDLSYESIRLDDAAGGFIGAVDVFVERITNRKADPRHTDTIFAKLGRMRGWEEGVFGSAFRYRELERDPTVCGTTLVYGYLQDLRPVDHTVVHSGWKEGAGHLNVRWQPNFFRTVLAFRRAVLRANDVALARRAATPAKVDDRPLRVLFLDRSTQGDRQVGDTGGLVEYIRKMSKGSVVVDTFDMGYGTSLEEAVSKVSKYDVLAGPEGVYNLILLYGRG